MKLRIAFLLLLSAISYMTIAQKMIGNGLIVPRMRVNIDNDFGGDPDGLFALAHHLLSPSVEVRAIIGSHLHPQDF